MKPMELIDGVVIGSEIYAPRYTLLDKSQSTVVFGQETYGLDHQYTMANPPDMSMSEMLKPIITTNGIEHNLYLNSCSALGDPRFINDLCIFLDTVKQGQINFYLGSGVSDEYLISVSPIVESIKNISKTPSVSVTTLAFGFCGIPETMIWTYGNKRIIGEYGAIRFGGGEWVRKSKDIFYPYLETYLDHCISLKLLSPEQKDDILVKQKEFMYIDDNGTLKAI